MKKVNLTPLARFSLHSVISGKDLKTDDEAALHEINGLLKKLRPASLKSRFVISNPATGETFTNFDALNADESTEEIELTAYQFKKLVDTLPTLTLKGGDLDWYFATKEELTRASKEQ